MAIDLRKDTPVTIIRNSKNTFTRITKRRQSKRAVYTPIYSPKISK